MNKPLRFCIEAIVALLLLFVAVYILPLAAALIFGAMQPLTGFKGYESTLRLNGASVEKTELYYTHQDKFVRDYRYRQTYTSGVVLQEERFNKWSPDTCAYYDRGSATNGITECHQYSLKNGGEYRVIIRREDNVVTYIGVSAKIANTELNLGISEDRYAEFIDYEDWERYFDSMKPKSLLFMPYDYRPPIEAGG